MSALAQPHNPPPNRPRKNASNAERHAWAQAEHIKLGARLRTLRMQAGLSQTQTATAIGIALPTWRNWELGTKAPRFIHGPAIAQALGVPVAALHSDGLVLAEVRVSDDTLERVKREGQPAADEAGSRIATSLSALLLAEATRPPVDVGPGARPKRRRSRAEVLAGVDAAKRGRKARLAAQRKTVQ